MAPIKNRLNQILGGWPLLDQVNSTNATETFVEYYMQFSISPAVYLAIDVDSNNTESRIVHVSDIQVYKPNLTMNTSSTHHKSVLA